MLAGHSGLDPLLVGGSLGNFNGMMVAVAELVEHLLALPDNCKLL